MEKKFSRMTYIQRQEIEKLLKEGRSMKEIAKQICKSNECSKCF